MGIYYEPDTMLNPLQGIFDLILTTTVGNVH